MVPEQNGNRAEHRRGALDPMSRPKRAHTVRPVTVSLRGRVYARTTAKGNSLGHVGSDECEECKVQVCRDKV